MESCHELLGEVIPQKKEYVVARLKRRFEGYRSRHAEALPLHQQHSESLYNQEKEHTQQLQQRFLESKTKKSKKDKSSVTGGQPRGPHHVHGAAHPLHQQPLQYMDSNVRVVTTSPVSHQTQAQQIRPPLQQDERLTPSRDSSDRGASSSVVDTRDEKNAFDDLLKSGSPFAHIKQEIPTRSDTRREYNDTSQQYIKSEIRPGGFMCNQNSSTDFLPESFANFPDGSLNPDVLRDLIADVAGNAGDLMADFNFDEVKSGPSSLDVMAPVDHAKPHHLQQQQKQQQQQQKTLQMAPCTLPLMSSNEPSCQSSISPFRNGPRGPSSPQAQVRGNHSSRSADSPVQTHQTQQKSNAIPPSSTAISSSGPSVSTGGAGPYPMTRSPLGGACNHSNHGSAMRSPGISRPSPNSMVGVSMPSATNSQQTSTIQIHSVSQPKLVNASVNSAAHSCSNRSHFDTKATVPTLGYRNQSQTGQQSTYMNPQSQATNSIRSPRSMPPNAQFQDVNHNRLQLQQQHQQAQLIRRESPLNQQRSAVFAQQAIHMSAQQHHEVAKSQAGPVYQRHPTINENVSHPSVHQQNQNNQQQQQQHQQQQHIQLLRQQQLQHHRLAQNDVRREETFNNEPRDAKAVPSNISSNPSFAEALAFNTSATPTERTAMNVHSILHQQQQQQHHQRQAQQCNQFRSIGNDHHAYQSSADSRAANAGLNQRVQQRPNYMQPPLSNQWRSYPEHCTQQTGHPMMSIQQSRNGGVNNNPMMMNRQNSESQDLGGHTDHLLPSSGIEHRTLGNSSSASSIDFNNLEFLAGVEPTNELLNFDATSSALNMLDDVLGHQNVASTYKS